MEEVKECPVCENRQFIPFLTCEDYLVSHQAFTIKYCENCKLKLTSPRPTVDEIGYYYESEKYTSHHDDGKGLLDIVYRGIREIALKQKRTLIQSFTQHKGNVLDVGCGTGAFLETCQKAGWQIAGVEVNKDVRNRTSQKLQIPIAASVNELPEHPYDIITLWHVLEHIANLNETLEEIKKRIAKNGTLLIAVPNPESYDAKHFGKFWAAYDVPRHLFHFAPTVIEVLLKKHGFKLVRSEPMPFDAYYISLLSTKYQTGQMQYLKSIRIGMTSNRQAKKTGNASSMIYCFRLDSN